MAARGEAVIWIATAMAVTLEGCPEIPRPELDPGAFEFEVASVDSTRADIGTATAQAREVARVKLLERLQGGLPDVAVIELKRHVGTDALDPVVVGGRRTLACGYAFVESRFLGRIRTDADHLTNSIQILAHTTLQAVGEGAVFVAPAQTPEGCPARGVGDALTSRLKQALAKQGARMAVSVRDGYRLVVEVNAEDAEGVGVSASLWPVGARSSMPLPDGGFTVNPWVLVRDVPRALADARMACTPNAGWGLDATGRKRGRDGLAVEIEASADLERLEEGQQVAFTVTTTAPALVQMFSLSPDGQAWLSLPVEEPGGHRVVPAAPWRGGAVVFDAQDPPVPEQMLAVAVPQDRGFGRTKAWEGFCQVGGTLGPSDFPSDAAFQIVRFYVAGGSAAAPVEPPAFQPPEMVPDCATRREVPYLP